MQRSKRATTRVFTFGAKDELGKIEPEALWNEKLGLPKDDLEKSVRAVFNGKLAHEQ
jgi:hypothetical protein